MASTTPTAVRTATFGTVACSTDGTPTSSPDSRFDSDRPLPHGFGNRHESDGTDRVCRHDGPPDDVSDQLSVRSDGYERELRVAAAPTVLSGDQPRALPPNIVIDLDNSAPPSGWTAAGGYSDKLDVLFAPNGTVMGPVASAGRIHFVLSEFADATVPCPLPANSLVMGVRLMDATNTWSLGSTSGTYGPWAANTNYTLEKLGRAESAQRPGLSMRGRRADRRRQPAQSATVTPGSQITDGTVTWECYNPKTE